MKKMVTIEGMSCGHCAMRVKNALLEVEGVTEASVDLIEGKATVVGTGVDSNMLRGAVVKAGYTPTSILP
jgi:Cu+-exporting ATPase